MLPIKQTTISVCLRNSLSLTVFYIRMLVIFYGVVDLSKVKRKWDERDWWFFISLISLLQACIWFLSYHYGTGSSALGYISFAGTLISIILAVLAIGYTYGESLQQKNTSTALATQIQDLMDIKERLGNQVDVLEHIADLKTDINSIKSETINSFGRLVSLLDMDSEQKDSTDTKFMFINKITIVTISQFLIIMHIYDKNKFSNNREFGKYVLKYYEDIHENKDLVMYLTHAVVSLWLVSQNLNVMTFDSYDQELKKFILSKVSGYPDRLSSLRDELSDDIYSYYFNDQN